MARILRRPMFRKGGSTNEGIMHGLVNRRGYANGLGPGIEEKIAAQEKYAPLPKSRFPMGQIGLNLISGQYAGDGLLQNIGGSAMGPYSEWTKGQDLRDLARAERRGSAVSATISEQHAEKMARLKAMGETKLLKDESDQRARESLVTTFLEQTADLKPFEDKELQHIYHEEVAEYYIDVRRDLERSDNPMAKEILANKGRLVPYDTEKKEFEYDRMLPGLYYYDPRRRVFVKRVPDDPDTPKDESGYFQYDRVTYQKSRISGNK